MSQVYIQSKSGKLLSNINQTSSYNPLIYPYYIFKAQTAFMTNNKIEAIGLIEEVKIKSNDLWQEKDESILEALKK